MPVQLELAAPRSGVKHSTAEPLCSHEQKTITEENYWMHSMTRFFTEYTNKYGFKKHWLFKIEHCLSISCLIKTLPASVLYLLNLCKQFGSRSGPTKCRAWSGSKLFGTLMVYLNFPFKKCWFWKKSADNIKAWKIIQHSKSQKAYKTRTHSMACHRKSPRSRRYLMVFDPLTPSQGHQFDPRVKILSVSWSTAHPL